MPMGQRVQFIADYLRDTLSMTELYVLYNMSRKTGYKGGQRYLRRGPIRSRQIKPNALVAAILGARRHYPNWGAKKLLKILALALASSSYRVREPQS